MRYLAVAASCAVLFWLYAVMDRPTKEEELLAAEAAAYIAQQAGGLPLHMNSKPAPRTYGFHAARHGLIVFVTFGLTSQANRARVRAAAERALSEVPGLEAVSIESYEDHVTAGKARFFAREMVQRSRPRA